MALNFPSSPTNGQQYNGFVYNSTVQAWQANPASVAPFYTADTPPTNPTKGDSWFNTNDGTMYIYTYDGNTYQWVEHRSQIAKSQVGLTPVIPTSVNLPAGTASISSNGVVTLTNATSFSLNGCFTNSFTDYRVVYKMSGTSGGSNHSFYMRANGTTETGAYYTWYGMRWMSWNQAYIAGNGSTNWYLMESNSQTGAWYHAILDILSPYTTEATRYNDSGFLSGNSYYGSALSNGILKTTTQYDGFTISMSDAFSGTVQVFGYNK